MNLLRCSWADNGCLVVRLEKNVPLPTRYTILSHRWLPGEMTFQDCDNVWNIANDDRIRNIPGYGKVEGACIQTLRDGLDYVWVDTCCIDKTSSAELSEAINSMFSWYELSFRCYAYLSDVTAFEDPEAKESAFRRSAWFSRGWTLQELVAPMDVIFFDKSWHRIGTKASLTGTVSSITNIRREVLSKGLYANEVSVGEKMHWAAGRTTTREEDVAYSLMGLFSVYMPPIYGEGSRAFRRLQSEILKVSTDPSIFAWNGTATSASMLADSPSQFTIRTRPPVDYDEYVHTFGISGHKPQFEWTNAGLRIQLPIAEISGWPGYYEAYIACAIDDAPSTDVVPGTTDGERLTPGRRIDRMPAGETVDELARILNAQSKDELQISTGWLRFGTGRKLVDGTSAAHTMDKILTPPATQSGSAEAGNTTAWAKFGKGRRLGENPANMIAEQDIPEPLPAKPVASDSIGPINFGDQSKISERLGIQKSWTVIFLYRSPGKETGPFDRVRYGGNWVGHRSTSGCQPVRAKSLLVNLEQDSWPLCVPGLPAQLINKDPLESTMDPTRTLNVVLARGHRSIHVLDVWPRTCLTSPNQLSFDALSCKDWVMSQVDGKDVFPRLSGLIVARSLVVPRVTFQGRYVSGRRVTAFLVDNGLSEGRMLVTLAINKSAFFLLLHQVPDNLNISTYVSDTSENGTLLDINWHNEKVPGLVSSVPFSLNDQLAVQLGRYYVKVKRQRNCGTRVLEFRITIGLQVAPIYNSILSYELSSSIIADGVLSVEALTFQ